MEEAAALLRIGRTKAYAMAKEWRDTGGQSGLPVVDLGGVLRVVLPKLEELVGGPLTGPVPARVGWSSSGAAGNRPRVPAQPRQPTRPARATSRANAATKQRGTQLSLINPTEG